MMMAGGGDLGTLKLLLLGGVILLVLCALEALVGTGAVVVERVTIADPLLARTLRGLRVVHVSDFHLPSRPGRREARLLAALRELKPDLVFYTGDFIDRPASRLTVRELAAQLPARYGVYAVAGNNDHHVVSLEALARDLAGTPVRLLVNENVAVSLPGGRRLVVVGIDDPTTGHDRPAEAFAGVPRDEAVIALCHSPKILPDAVRVGAPLLLTGHTHGGQVRIPGIVQLFHALKGGGPLMGLYREQGTWLYINRGIGVRTVPFRVFCRPEVTVLEFEEKPAGDR